MLWIYSFFFFSFLDIFLSLEKGYSLDYREMRRTRSVNQAVSV